MRLLLQAEHCGLSVYNGRELCKNGWNDRWGMWIQMGPSSHVLDGVHTWRGNFEGEKGPAQDMPGHVRRSIYSKRLSRGQQRYGAVANWCELGRVHIGEYNWTVRMRRRCGQIYFGHLTLFWTEICLITYVLFSVVMSFTIFGDSMAAASHNDMRRWVCPSIDVFSIQAVVDMFSLHVPRPRARRLWVLRTRIQRLQTALSSWTGYEQDICVHRR